MRSPCLTPLESSVLQDTQFFITKASIDAKINDLFSVLKTQLVAIHADVPGMPPALLASPGRLYRGEHFGPLPWRAMDSPRYFAGKDMFAFRTLLIWGKEFSFHLLLGGQCLQTYGPLLPFSMLATNDWRMSIQESPWDWTLNDKSHVPLLRLSPEEWKAAIEGGGWLKLSVPLPLEAFDSVPDVGARLWTSLTSIFQ